MWIHSTIAAPAIETRLYRAYPIDGDGSIEGPAVGFVAGSDEEALRKAHAELGLQRVEVWSGTRLLHERRRAS